MSRATAFVAGMLLAVTAQAQSETFRVSLAGAGVPGGQGDPDGAGVAFVTVDGTKVSYYVWAKGIAAPSGATLRSGRAGESGGAVLDLGAAFAGAGGPETWVAAGSAAADAALAAAIAAAPGAYYLAVADGAFPDGAVRGQLAGSDASPLAAATTLSGQRVVGSGGDPGGSGFAGVVVDGETAWCYVRFAGIGQPEAARVRRGVAGANGPAVVTFSAAPAVVDGAIVASAPVAADVGREILRDPAGFFVDVTDAGFPDGALRGQLAPTETVRVFPVIAHVKGAGTSVFKSDVRVLNLVDEPARVWAEWYPKTASGAGGPGKVVAIVVTSRAEAVLDDAVGTLFGANDRGAVRLVSATPFHAVANTYNDQRPSGSGTFGQYVEALPLAQALTAGGLLLNSNRPKADLLDFRTNLGYFNPNPAPVAVTFNVRKPDGSLVNTPTTQTIPAFANDLQLYYQVVAGVPAALRTQANFTITYSASGPLFVFSSVVDNKTDDGLQQPALPIAAAQVQLANRPPDGTITAPAPGATSIAGDSVAFTASATDPDGDPVTFAWSFGDGSAATGAAASHAYAAPGSYTVTLTATDAHGAADPTPATLAVSVTADAPPDAAILTPATDVAVRAGQGVSFTGAASDPDGDAVTVLWNFGDGATSTALAPGEHVYAGAGTFTVTLTATDSHGVADPTPATRTVTVSADSPPDGTITAPGADVTTSVGQAVTFEGSATDPDGDPVTVRWDFGDGVSSTAAATTHAYLAAGTFTVTFTAADSFGLADPTPATRTVTVTAPAPTLTQLQAEIFTPFCSGCHPPNQSLDLRSGHTFASAVNVNSSEQPSLKRVKPGDPDNSYLVRKISGTAGITGSRMPLGGPFLTPEEIQKIRDWILAGAANN